MRGSGTRITCGACGSTCFSVFRFLWVVSALLGGDYPTLLKRCRLRSSSNGWPAVILRSPQLLIRAGRLHVLGLNWGRWEMLLMCCSLLFCRWPCLDSVTSAVVTDTRHLCGIVHYGRVVDIVDDGDVHVVH